MKTTLLTASLMVCFALTPGLAVSQESPSPQMPATPSMDQKGGDMSKPAGGKAGMAGGMAKTSHKSKKVRMSKHGKMSKHRMSKHGKMKGHMSKHHKMKGHKSHKAM